MLLRVFKGLAVVALVMTPLVARAATTFVSPVQTYSCTNQVATALAQGTGATTCSTVTAAMFGSSITGGTVFGNNTGSAGTPAFSAVPVLGVNASTAGTLGLANGGGSGATVTIQNPSATSAYNFNLPATVGSAGQALISEGGGSTAMQWANILSSQMTVVSKVTSYQVATTTDDWKRFDDTGAGSGVTFTLPTAANTAAGDNWCFTEVSAHNISIAVNATQIITMGNIAGTTGTGTLTSSGAGSTVCMYAQSSTNIQVYSSNGGWTNN